MRFLGDNQSFSAVKDNTSGGMIITNHTYAGQNLYLSKKEAEDLLDWLLEEYKQNE